jgi:predicted nucleic acid-binding protein
MDEFRDQLLANRLASHRIVGIDSAIFIYQIENHPVYQSLARIVLSGIVDRHYEGVTSVITLMELTVHPWRANLERVAREFETLLVRFPNLHLVEINRDTARHAARLRARFGLRTPDALQVAAVLDQGATALVTNDLGLRHLSGLLDIIILREFIRG